MKKILSLLAFVLAGTLAFAQDGQNNDPADDPNAEENVVSNHGTEISDLAKTTENGKGKGSIISSAARAKSLMHANANANFNRSGMPEQSNQTTGMPETTGKPDELPTTTNGKPTTLPPVSAPTTSQPTVTPVGKPAGVPVGSKPTGIPGGN